MKLHGYYQERQAPAGLSEKADESGRLKLIAAPSGPLGPQQQAQFSIPPSHGRGPEYLLSPSWPPVSLLPSPRSTAGFLRNLDISRLWKGCPERRKKGKATLKRYVKYLARLQFVMFKED